MTKLKNTGTGSAAMEKKDKLRSLTRACWDFSECPKDELSFCEAYEYFRQVAMAHRERFKKKTDIGKWSPAVFAEVFKGYFQDGKRIELKGIVDGAADPFEINLAAKQMFAVAASQCSGFPDTPYLELKAEERKAWVKAFGLDQLRPDRPTMAQLDFFGICLNPRQALRQYQSHGIEWARQHLVAESKSKAKADRWIVSHDGFQFELGVIRLNWSLSNKRLANAFAQWLEANRPAEAKIFETRGATQPAETLKYLSAMRLLTVMTAKNAYDYTEKLLGKPIYNSDDNWYEARNKADSGMRQISSPFFDWAKTEKAGS
jgi:hypothetical protein